MVSILKCSCDEEVEQPSLSAGENRIYFVPLVLTKKESEEAMTQMSCGSSVPVATWNNSNIVSVVWCVKWAVTGLTPVRPLVVTRAEIQLEPGRAIKIA